MRAVWIGVPETFLEERHRLDQDKKDELWEGVLHMVPPAAGIHSIAKTDLIVALAAIAKRRGLRVRTEYGVFQHAKNYRVPDVTLVRPELESARGGEGAELVIEVLSPDDESREKLPFYARVGVREVWLIEPATRTFEIFTLQGHEYQPVSVVDGSARSPVLGIELRVAAGSLELHDGDDVHVIGVGESPTALTVPIAQLAVAPGERPGRNVADGSRVRTILLALLLAGCSMDRTAEVPEVQPHGVVTQQYLDNAPQRVDILFVIDSSPAMAAVEDRVRAAISDVANVAEARLAGPRSDVHVGVITADPHDGGILRRTALFDGAYLIDRKTTAANHDNYPGAFAPALLDLTDVGMAGSSENQPLEALRTALAGNPHNEGFLRPDAKLAIVILTAQDDASPGELADYTSFLRGLKADEDDVMVAVAGTDASCGGTANPRLQSFAGTRFTTLCDGDLSYFVFTNACVPDSTGSFPNPCLYADLLDTDPLTPGIQADCNASDLGGSYGACDAGNPTPCWRTKAAPNVCGEDQQFTIDRGDADPPSTQNLVTVQCVTR